MKDLKQTKSELREQLLEILPMGGHVPLDTTEIRKQIESLLSQQREQAYTQGKEEANNKMAYKIYGLLSSYLIHSNPELADKAMKKLSDYLQPYVNKQFKKLNQLSIKQKDNIK